jgi:type I restriction enzyme R subunit
MSTVGQRERQTQARVIKLLHRQLGYDYLGNWIDRANNRNVEEELLRDWLTRRGVSKNLSFQKPDRPSPAPARQNSRPR